MPNKIRLVLPVLFETFRSMRSPVSNKSEIAASSVVACGLSMNRYTSIYTPIYSILVCSLLFKTSRKCTVFGEAAALSVLERPWRSREYLVLDFVVSVKFTLSLDSAPAFQPPSPEYYSSYFRIAPKQPLFRQRRLGLPRTLAKFE